MGGSGAVGPTRLAGDQGGNLGGGVEEPIIVDPLFGCLPSYSIGIRLARDRLVYLSHMPGIHPSESWDSPPGAFRHRCTSRISRQMACNTLTRVVAGKERT
jgi:hypothetical protein